MTIIDRRTTSVFFTVLVWSISVLIVYLARNPLLMMIFGVVFAYLLEPLVVSFQTKLKFSREFAIAVTYVCLLLAMSIFLTFAGPKILEGAQTLTRELPSMTEKVGNGEIARELGDKRGWSYETKLELQQLLANNRNSIRSIVQSLWSRATTAVGGIAWMGLIPIFAIFVLKGKSRFAAALFALADEYHDRRFLRAVLNDMDLMLASYIRAQLAIAGLSMTAYMVFLGLIGFPFSFLIAGIGGVLEFIPVAGPLASAALILSMTVLVGYPNWLWIVFFLIGWRILQDYVIFPLLMGRGLKLPALAVLLGIFVGGEVAGVAGIYLSIPILATMRIITKNWKTRAEVIQNENSPASVQESKTDSESSGPYCEFGAKGRNFQTGTGEGADCFSHVQEG